MDIKAFRGLNNVSDPLRAGLQWLSVADNVDITSTGAMKKREGYSLAMAGSITAAFATKDQLRAYIVDGGTLKTFDGGAGVALRSGISSAPMHWAEINGEVFFNNGTERGIIRGDNTLLDWAWPVPAAPQLAPITGNLDPGLYRVRCAFVLPDGRLTGGGPISEIDLAAGQALSISAIPQAAGCQTEVYICAANTTEFLLAARTTATALNWLLSADALGESLDADDLSPLPVGATEICFWRGRAYAAQYLPESEQTVVWASQPLAFHLFNLAEDFILVPGRVVMLEPTKDGLVIGTAIGNGDRVHAYTGDTLVELAPYGVVPGWPADLDEDTGKAMFWTARGLCSALPFANHTEQHVSVAPGVRAGARIVRTGGEKRFLVSLHAGGAPFNAFS